MTVDPDGLSLLLVVLVAFGAVFGWMSGAVHERVKMAKEMNMQPRLKVRLTCFPESNGKTNWTALLIREEKWDGLIGNCGGITIDRGECWNRVAYEAERARYLLGQRDTEPHILDYGDDIKTPEEWKGETHLAQYEGLRRKRKQK